MPLIDINNTKIVPIIVTHGGTRVIEFVKKFMPHTLFLHHFDDTFPPLSSAVDTTKFNEITHLFPDILVILPQYGISYTV